MHVRTARLGIAALSILALVHCDDPLRPLPGNSAPVATISSPTDGAIFYAGETITFRGAAADAEDGPLPHSQLRWESGADSSFGSGAEFDRSDLPVGIHTLRLIATDSLGLSDTAYVAVHVIPLPPAIDTRTPIVDSIRIEPDTIDVTTDSVAVAVRLHVSDDLSGAAYLVLQLSSPSGELTLTAAASQPASGTRLDGFWDLVIALPHYTEPGEWIVSEVIVADSMGNVASLSANELAARGLRTGVQVLRGADTVVPALRSLTIEPDSVEVGQSAVTVMIELLVEDSLAGTRSVTVTLASPSGTRSLEAHSSQPIGGTTRDGTWRLAVTMPAHIESGAWMIASLELRDAAGNEASWSGADLAEAGFEHEIDVTNANPDTLPPTLVWLALEPDTVAIGSPVTAQLALRDALAGIDSVTLTMTSATDSQSLVFTQAAPVGGSRTDGIWEVPLFLPTIGEWSLSARLVDQAGNSVALSASELAAAGFETRIIVHQPDNGFFTLTELRLDPDTVDVTNGAADVIIRIGGRFASGGGNLTMLLRGPGQSNAVLTWIASPSGTTTDGIWMDTLTIPRHALPGDWVVEWLQVTDDWGYEGEFFSTVYLASLGAETEFHVLDADPDTTAPVLTSLSVQPDTVSVAAGSAQVAITMALGDDLTGVEGVIVRAVSPSEYAQLELSLASPSSGTRLDGVWTGTLDVYQSAEFGTWRLSVYVYDSAGNALLLQHLDLQAGGSEGTFYVR